MSEQEEKLVAAGFDVQATFFEGGEAFCGVWRSGVKQSFDIPEFKNQYEFDEWWEKMIYRHLHNRVFVLKYILFFSVSFCAFLFFILL